MYIISDTWNNFDRELWIVVYLIILHCNDVDNVNSVVSFRFKENFNTKFVSILFSWAKKNENNYKYIDLSKFCQVLFSLLHNVNNVF